MPHRADRRHGRGDLVHAVLLVEHDAAKPSRATFSATIGAGSAHQAV